MTEEKKERFLKESGNIEDFNSLRKKTGKFD